MEIIKSTGIKPSIIRAGNTNMFLSPVFRESLANLTGATIELYDTDGSQGAAKGAGVGCGYYSGFENAFNSLKKLQVIEPNESTREQITEAYEIWSDELKIHLENM